MSTHRDPGAHAPAIAAGLGSVALSALVLARRPLVNNDGVFYLMAAEAFENGGLDAARAFHGWPFHSILIAGVAGLLGVSTEAAAQGVGAALIAVACVAFVLVVRALGGDRRVEWMAAAVVLAHPWLDRSRALVVRDCGVWAFGLLALLALLRLGHAQRASLAVRWAVCSAAAVLFRPDAVALMTAAPLAAALRRETPPRERIAFVMAVLLPTIAIGVWTVRWLYADPSFDVSPAPFRTAAAALAASFPLPYGREYSSLILAAGLAAVPVVKTLKAAGLVHLALAVVALVRGAIGRFDRAVLWATLAAAMVPLYVQVVRLLFVESRYTVFATLVLSLWAPFGLAALLRPEAPRGWRLAGVAAVAGLAVTLAASLPLRETNGDHLRAAAGWIRDHPAAGRLHTNSLQLAYFAGRAVDWRLVRNAAVNGALDGDLAGRGEVWAVRVAPDDAALRSRLDAMTLFAPAASFKAPDGDEVRIYACTGAAGCISGS